jgi:putative oxidoreductase
MLQRIQALVDEWSAKLSWLPPLLARVAIGIAFILGGLGKLKGIDGVIAFFGELGIPAPQIMAPFVAGTELIGGIMLVLGLGTRIAALALASTMVVATLTAVWPKLEDKAGIFSAIEIAYLVIFVWLAIAGPGRASVDHILRKSIGRPSANRF